jgi:uncharacterized protein
VQQRFLPLAVVLHAGSHAHVAGMTAKDGQATAYVCQNYSCQAPVTEVAELIKLLE